MRARSGLVAAATLLALFLFVDRFVLAELLVQRIALPLVVACAVALAALAIGALLRRATHVDPALDLLLGYPLFGTLCFLIGTIHIGAATMLPIVIAGAIGGVWLLAKRPPEPLPPIAGALGLLAIAAVLACGFVAAQAPAYSLDEVAYHLAVPHTWALEGRAIELPLLSHSYFPLGIESADLPALALLDAIDAGIASHLLHLFAAIATTLLIARRTRSWLATAAIVTTPALAITAGWSLVDWPLAGSFVALFVALEDDDLRTASLATAAGLLTKYTFAPFALVAWALERRIPRWPILLGGVFFARNLLITGNPFAPFFSAAAPHVSGYRTLSLTGYLFDGRFIDEALGVTIVTLPLLATGLLAIASAVLALALFLLAPSSRVLVPFLIAPVMSAATALQKRAIAALVAVAIVVQTFLVIWFTARDGAFSLLAGTTSEDEFLRQTRVGYAAIVAVNNALTPHSRTLVVGLSETYWFAKAVRGGGNFDGPRVSRYLESPQLREALQRDGITHVAIFRLAPQTNVAAKRDERRTALSPAANANLLATLARGATPVLRTPDAMLFALR